jgi:alpha-ketoglutarate-dependent taurine dioxygenase
MTVAEKIRLATVNIKPNIGTKVFNSKAELLSGDLAEDLKELLEQRGVLVFPQIRFTDDEQIAFTKTLGPQLAEGVDGDGILNISLDASKNPRREYLKGASYWHIDGTSHPKPIGRAILSSKVLASWGGNTEFCNTYAAYDDLPQGRKEEIDNLRVVHTFWNSQLFHCPEPTLAQLEEWQSKGQVELPLVWKHRSGRRSLILGNTAQEVIGMDRAASARLLHGLREWATSEPYHYAHQWLEGDTVMWDNTGTMHRAMPYDPECGRLLRRTITAGEEPYA